MKARALRQTTIALLAFAGAMPAVHAQNDPSMEACIRYAEAGVVFENAKMVAKNIYENNDKVAEQEAILQDANAAIGKLRDAHDAAVQDAVTANPALQEWLDQDPIIRLTTAGPEPLDVLDETYNAATYDLRITAITAMGKRDDARKIAKVAYDTAIEEARDILNQTYLVIYADSGGMQSEVWDVMVKLLTHQRNRCTELYGL